MKSTKIPEMTPGREYPMAVEGPGGARTEFVVSPSFGDAALRIWQAAAKAAGSPTLVVGVGGDAKALVPTAAGSVTVASEAAALWNAMADGGDPWFAAPFGGARWRLAASAPPAPAAGPDQQECEGARGNGPAQAAYPESFMELGGRRE